MTLAVFVNTCDAFQDCWIPFFRLFETYGGILRELPIYLNTERADFDWPGCTIHCTKVWPREEENLPPWSERLLRGLDSVKERHVLYLQEDYFLKSAVRAEMIQQALEIFAQLPDAGAVYLTSHGPQVRRSLPYSKDFLQVQPPARYLISAQAAIWEKDFLRSAIRSWENVWMFEKFGTLRARHARRRVFAPTPDALAGGDIVDYVWTGIIQGKWKRDCVDLFRRHGIIVDFDRRGFYREESIMKHHLRILNALFGRPVPALRSVLSLLTASNLP
jgi:hypothetical protein